MTGPEPGIDLAAVAELAEEGDAERFFAAGLARPEERSRLHALIAFNCELAKIPVSVSEPMLGEIRLAWWREAIDDLFDKGVARAHEAMQGLAATRGDADWDRELLTRMIDARALSLGGLPLDVETCGDFIRDTGGAYHRLAVAALGGRSEAAQAVAAKVGWAEGAARLADALRREAAETASNEDVTAVIATLVEKGRDALAKARERRADVPFSARAPLMSALFADDLLSDSPDAPKSLGRRLGFAMRMATRRF